MCLFLYTSLRFCSFAPLLLSLSLSPQRERGPSRSPFGTHHLVVLTISDISQGPNFAVWQFSEGELTEEIAQVGHSETLTSPDEGGPVCDCFHLQTSFGWSVNIYTKEVLCFSLEFFSFSWRCCLGSLFTNEEQKKVGSIVTYLPLLPHMSALFVTSLIQVAGREFFLSVGF